MTRQQMIDLLARYRRPGSPNYGCHFQGLPAEIVRRGNVRGLVAILRDAALPAKVREHAAGALGEIGDRRAVGTLVEALGEPGLRRGAAVALGRMKATRAAKALKPLAARVKAARWALFQLGPAGTVEEVLDDLRCGQLRHIRPKLGRLPDAFREKVQAEIVRRFRRSLDRGHEDLRWYVTALTTFRDPAAPALLARTLRRAWKRLGPVVGLRTKRTCCGGLHKRTLRALKTNPSRDAAASLVQTVTNRYRTHALMAIKRLRELDGGGLSDRQIARMLDTSAAIRKPIRSAREHVQSLCGLARFAGDYGGPACRRSLERLRRRFRSDQPTKAAEAAVRRIDARRRRREDA